jgi:hypothetical protein
VIAAPQSPDNRPIFAHAYPPDPELDRLLDQFQRGDYATVRTASVDLAARTSDPAVARAARDLRKRLDPDPLALYLLGLTLALLAFLTAWFLWYARP